VQPARRGKRGSDRGETTETGFGSRLERALGTELGALRIDAWAALRYEDERRIGELALGNAGERRPDLERIARAEHAVMLLEGRCPIVAPARAPLAPYRHGLLLICGEGEAASALVVLLREERGAGFTEADVRIAVRALPLISRRIAQAPTAPRATADAHEHLRARAQPAQAVLSRTLAVEYTWSPPGTSVGDLLCGEDATLRLEPQLEAAVAAVVATWTDDPATMREATAIPRQALVMRVVPLRGPAGLRIGVTFERLKTRNAVASAARRFGLSPRELDVLAHVLEGHDTPRVADLLGIAPSTVNDHVKRMFAKTESRNRAELAARILGWKAER